MADDNEPTTSPEERMEFLNDVENSEAYRALGVAVKAQDISEDKATILKSKYVAIHSALMKFMDNDKKLIARAKTLNTQLNFEKKKVDFQNSTAGQDERTPVDVLRDDAEQAESEAALCRDREQILELEVCDLQRQRNDVQEVIDEIEREQAAAMAPTIRQYKGEVEKVRFDMTEDQFHVDASIKGLAEGRKRMAAMKEEKTANLEERSESRLNLEKVSLLPEKIKKGSDVVSAALRALKAQDDRSNNRLKDCELEIASKTDSARHLGEELAKLTASLERARAAIEGKDRGAGELKKEIDRESYDTDAHLEEQCRLELVSKNILMDLRHANERLILSNKERETTNRKYKRTLKELMVGHDALPPVATTKSVIAHEVELMHEEERKTQDVIAELKKDVDVYMNTYLKEETRGKEKGIFYQASYAEVAELEQEVVQLKKEERVRERTVVELASQRERASRLAAMKLKRLKETLEVRRVKELIIVDLKKQRREASVRLRDFQQLYDLVKNQRNKFVNLIQASSQSIAEMKEKLKILLNEVEILRGEIVSKEKLLAKAQIDHSAAVVDRNHLQAEMNKGSVVFRDKQTLVDEQISEMDKLNAVINGYEKEMLRHKKQYETQVELRNHAGITLIDRNDELCILYEKANIQELVCKQGDVAVASRADEIRLLRLEMQEVMRSVGVTRKMLPQIPCLDQDIMQLQEQLLHVRAQSAELSEALESPENKLRWRRLEGKIPYKEELVAKVTQLEERLNDKKEQLLEKELVLEEVSSLADRLRQQAAEGRSDTLELAKKVNDYQQKIRGITRKMMATVSELSMYQASSLKLQSEKHGLTAELEDAQINLESGEPPTLDAEREWFRMERDRLALLELRERLAEEAAEDVGGAGGDVKTTAEPRPNAYIPEDALGIPKPYSTYAPFKPTEPGSTMRFIRKPVPREIVI